jgi:HTH-type transcriptional regulator/antitoxin MqsA
MGDQNCTERTCPECGHLMVRDEARPFIIRYKSLSATFAMPGFYCVNCGEGVHTGKDMDVSDRNFNLLKAQAKNLLSPTEVRRIRKKLRLNQEAAGQILGGDPNAFHKYEKEDVLPPQAISNLLRVLEALPNGTSNSAMTKCDCRIVHFCPLRQLT